MLTDLNDKKKVYWLIQFFMKQVTRMWITLNEKMPKKQKQQ